MTYGNDAQDNAQGGGTRTAEAARDAAQNVGQQVRSRTGDVATTATTEAQQVVGEVRERAGQVAQEATERARTAVDDLREELRRQADEQGARAADALRNGSRQLRAMSETQHDRGVLTDMAGEAAQRLERVASELENGRPEQVLEDVRSFGRRRPGVFLLAAGAAGFFAARLLRNASLSGAGGGSSSSAGQTPMMPPGYGEQLPFTPELSGSGAAVAPLAAPGVQPDPLLVGSIPPTEDLS
jgi:hypothetical protein